MKAPKKIELLKLTDGELDSKVKIQGTMYDRKRKLSESTLKKIAKMAKSTTYSKIARELGLCASTVRYHTDEAWRVHYNATRDGSHTGKDKITVKDRVAYKRALVAAGKISA